MVQVTLRYMRVTPKKARMVVDMVRGRNVADAINILQNSPRKASALVGKLLRSGVAAAEQRGDLDTEILVVKQIFVGEGPRIKRFQAAARGRGARIVHRTSHVTVVLDEA